MKTSGPGLRTFFALQLFLFFAIFTGCGKKQEEETVLPDGSEKISFSGSISDVPGEFGNRPFRLRLRAYYCGQTNPSDREKYLRECQKSFQEKIIDSVGSYAADLSVSPGWSHASVQLLDTDEVAGLYSPGPNPYWIRNTAGLNSFSHDFQFESQENPLPDAKQEALAASFAPILVFQAGKKYPPSNLEKYAGKQSIEKVERLSQNTDCSNLAGEDEEYMVLPESLPPGSTRLYYHVRWADTFVSGTQEEALPGWRDNRNYRYRRGNGDIVISFWIWYDMNEGPTSFGNVHQGDLESFAVLVDESGRPLRFMATGHDHVMIDTVWQNINSVNNHPIVYIASGNRGADGGNPGSPYGGYSVSLDAGNALFNWISDPVDVFPTLLDGAKAIVPADLNTETLNSVRIGPGERLGLTSYVDLRNHLAGKIEKLVKWEEPAWINRPAFLDPDGHHRVDADIAGFLAFDGRLGRHPRTRMNWLTLTRYGESPMNAPFKTNIEQHFTFERPREDRFYSGRVGNYGPKFHGDADTPQFIR